MHVAIDPFDEQRLGEAICAFKEQQEYGELIDYLIRAIASGGMPAAMQAKAYNELGLAHLQSEKPVEAEKAFLSAIERDPGCLNPRFNLANLALYAQKYDRGLELFRDILDIDPTHAGALHHAGLCLAMKDRHEEALSYFEKSAEIAPEAMGPNFWAGECLIKLGLFDRALPYFKSALAIMPDHEESLRGLAICHFEQKDYQECLAICDVLIANGRGAEYLALRIKGDALLELGEGEKAAYCHLGLAQLDFDARDYLHMRVGELKKQGSDQADVYAETIADNLRGLDAEFLELLPEME